jgi:hypothetical protein
MLGRVGLTACAFTLLAVTGVLAQQVVTGTAVRIDQPAGVVILDNGQMYQTTPQTVILVNSQPTTIGAIAPGTPVVLQSAQTVAYRDGRYVVVAPPAHTPYEVSGLVRWVTFEPGRTSLTLDSGRLVWIDEDTQVLANGVPAMMSTLRPGTFVVIRSAKPIAFRDADRRIVAPRAAAPVTVEPSPSAMPGALYHPVMPSGPTAPQMGLRERENDRQEP